MEWFFLKEAYKGRSFFLGKFVGIDLFDESDNCEDDDEWLELLDSFDLLDSTDDEDECLLERERLLREGELLESSSFGGFFGLIFALKDGLKYCIVAEGR